MTLMLDRYEMGLLSLKKTKKLTFRKQQVHVSPC